MKPTPMPQHRNTSSAVGGEFSSSSRLLIGIIINNVNGTDAPTKAADYPQVSANKITAARRQMIAFEPCHGAACLYMLPNRATAEVKSDLIAG